MTKHQCGATLCESEPAYVLCLYPSSYRPGSSSILPSISPAPMHSLLLTTIQRQSKCRKHVVFDAIDGMDTNLSWPKLSPIYSMARMERISSLWRSHSRHSLQQLPRSLCPCVPVPTTHSALRVVYNSVLYCTALHDTVARRPLSLKVESETA